MELVIEWDPPQGATHRVRWEVDGPPDDALTSADGTHATARLACPPDSGSATGWLLRSEVASPIADTLNTEGVVLVFAYIPRDRVEMLEFDRRITERYTEFCATTGEYYAGTVSCDAWTPEFLGDVVWYDVTTVDEANEIGVGIPLPDDVAAIANECRERQNRERTRHVIFFEPIPH